MSRNLISFVLLAAFASSPAFAYVGPGSSLSAIGVALGLVGTVFLSLFSLVWYPVKRLCRRLAQALGRLRSATE